MVSERQAALITGIGLLVMTILAPFAQFFVLQDLIVPGDAQATAANLMASGGLFRSAILALLIVAILDVVVAWALHLLMGPVNASLSLLAALFRVVYAAIFAGALTHLMNAGGGDPAQMMQSLEAFRHGWDIALVIFGLHLLLLGVLMFRSSSRILGILVALSGVGYLVDSLGKILVPGYSFTISTFTFVGEAVLMVWLLWRGMRRSRA